MQVLGYSERGVINSFFYEMAYTHKGAFQEFLNLIQPMINTNEQSEASKFPEFELKTDTKPTIIIEPSFSEFGDADAVIMFKDEKKGNTVLFVEAKVCAEKPWDFSKDVLRKFELGVVAIFNKKNKLESSHLPKGFTSTLLIQLYHKFGMMCKLDRTNDAKLEISPNFGRIDWKRSIGKNQTVLEVYKKITDHINKECNNVYYIGIVPSGTGLPLNPIQPSFKTATTLDKSFTCFQERLGYITWQKIYDNIVKNNMPNTDEVFKLNQAAVIGRTKNQIYNPVIENAPNNP